MVEALLYAFLSVFLLFLAVNIFLAIAKRVFRSFTNKKVPKSTDKLSIIEQPENKPVSNNFPDSNSRKKSRTSAISVVFLIILILLSFIGGAFYWYELRPSEIRKNCFKEAQEVVDKEEAFVTKFLPEKVKDKKAIAYSECLIKNGLEAENLND